MSVKFILTSQFSSRLAAKAFEFCIKILVTGQHGPGPFSKRARVALPTFHVGIVPRKYIWRIKKPAIAQPAGFQKLSVQLQEYDVQLKKRI
jgi:hypothetical protein